MQGIHQECIPMGMPGHKVGQLFVAWTGKHVDPWLYPRLEIVQKMQKEFAVQSAIVPAQTLSGQAIGLILGRLDQFDVQQNVATHAPLPKISHAMVEMSQTPTSFVKVAESN